MREVLRARGIEPDADFVEEPELLAAASLEVVMAAALACTDEADFRRRLRDPSARPAGLPERALPSGARARASGEAGRRVSGGGR